MDDETPPPATEPFGALVPPRKPPATAIATASPAPLLPRREPQRTMRPRTVRRLIDDTLDLVDELADSLAEGLGLRST
jgi:hypothetical protein